MALPWSRTALTWYAAAAALIVVVTGMALWGIHERHTEPRWYVGQHLTKRQARGVLLSSIADLHTARLTARVSGALAIDMHGYVDYSRPGIAASLRTVTASKPHRRVPLVIRGSQAYLHLHRNGQSGWARLAVNPRAKGYVTTTVSQITGGIDLPRLFRGAANGVTRAVYEGKQSGDGVTGDVFQMRVYAWAVRELLPSLLTQRSPNIRREVPATFVLDPAGRLLTFATVMNHDAVEVSVTGRNPVVRIEHPTGTIVPLASVAPGL